jgi:hypothetical protein
VDVSVKGYSGRWRIGIKVSRVNDLCVPIARVNGSLLILITQWLAWRVRKSEFFIMYKYV